MWNWSSYLFCIRNCLLIYYFNGIFTLKQQNTHQQKKHKEKQKSSQSNPRKNFLLLLPTTCFSSFRVRNPGYIVRSTSCPSSSSSSSPQTANVKWLMPFVGESLIFCLQRVFHLFFFSYHDLNHTNPALVAWKLQQRHWWVGKFAESLFV